MTQESKFDLEQRLLIYATSIVRIVDMMDRTATGAHVGQQLMRAGTSPLFNQGEAQSAESSKDFIHKMKICLKELRETRRALLLVQHVPLMRNTEPLAAALQETEQLIRIFFTSIRTASTNMLRENSPDYAVSHLNVEC